MFQILFEFIFNDNSSTRQFSIETKDVLQKQVISFYTQNNNKATHFEVCLTAQKSRKNQLQRVKIMRSALLRLLLLPNIWYLSPIRNPPVVFFLIYCIL